MKCYLRILSGLYFIGALLHLLDFLDLRLHFSEMNGVWKAWITYLFAFDIATAIGLWNQRRWGIALFICVAISQLIAYVGFADFFGTQYPLIVFHLITLTTFLFFVNQQKGLVSK